MYPHEEDTREFGPEPDEERCLMCGASEDEDCADDCGCWHCLRSLPREVNE